MPKVRDDAVSETSYRRLDNEKGIFNYRLRDVIGREGSVIIVRVKRSGTSDVLGRDSM